jgi:hypothetical protein
MAVGPRGNGSGGGNVVIDPLAPDWIVARTRPAEPDRSRVPGLLLKALVRWLGQRSCRVGAALGIVTEGYTTQIHLWYDEPDFERPGPQELWVRGGVAVQELMPGWVIVKVAGPVEGQPLTAEHLLGALQGWLREHPTLEVTATLGIEEASETTALLVWLELHTDDLE